MSTGVETDVQLRGRHIVVTRSLVPLAGRSQHDVPEAVHSRGRSRELLERAFDDGNSSARMRNLLVLFQVGSKFLPCFPFYRSIRDRSRCHYDSCHWASNGVLVSLGVRRGEGSVAVSLDEQLVFSAVLGSVVLSPSIMFVFLLVELNEVLDRLRQGPSQSPRRVETSDTSGEETDASQGRRKILSKKTYRMKKVYAATELGRFLVTGPPDAANVPSHFYCRLCRKNVPVLTHGHHEVFRHFQGRRHFARDRRLRLETPGSRVLDFQANPLTEDELERQKEKIQKGPLVVRDREHPFAEDFISDEAGVIDPQLPVLTKVSCLVDGLKMGGSYGLIEKLWVQFVLTAGPVKREVAWTRDEVLVGSVGFRNPFVSFPDSNCCFAFSQSSLLECCREFCRELLGGQRLIVSLALGLKSVASHCGPSCGRGRRALSVGLLWMFSTVSQLMLHTM